MYELSRRRELGLVTSRLNAFEVLRSRSIIPIAVLGIILMVVYFIWMFVAQGIYNIVFGGVVPESIGAFAQQVFATSSGLVLIIGGSAVGFLFAALVLTISVVSFPMLLDRDVGVMTAVQTSISAVLANPMTMAMWGLIVAVTLAVGSVPIFVGLAVVLPVLGHATWHIYRKVVEP